MIAPRKLAIEALEERFKKYPNGMPEKLVGELGRSRVERGLGVMPRKSVEVFSDVGIIHFNHSLATEDRQKRQRKNLGQIKAYDIPVWGKAEALVQKFY